jgi:methylmalonyl-CoA mutase
MFFTNDFTAQTKEDWLKQVSKELKGKPLDLVVRQALSSDLTLEPYYTKEENADLEYLSSFENSHIKNSDDLSQVRWYNRAAVNFTNEGDTNKEILSLLNSGVEGVNIYIEKPIKDWPKLLNGVALPYCEINFVFTELPTALEVIETFLISCGTNQIKGVFYFDQPLEWYVENEKQLIDWYKEVIPLLNQFRSFRGIVIPAFGFQNKGFPITHEIAHTLHYMYRVVSQLAAYGIELKNLVRHMELMTSIGSKYNEEIAKIKAYRILSFQVFQSLGYATFDPSDLYISATSSIWNRAIQDEDNNILRNVVAAMAGAIGGVNGLYVQAHDKTFRESSEFSKRIAKNISVLMREESHLDKIVDPVAGSYYFKHLIDLTAKKSWEIFQEKTNQEYDPGKVLEEGEQHRRSFLQKLADEKEVLIGVNKFINDKDSFSDKEVEQQNSIQNPSTFYLNKTQK